MTEDRVLTLLRESRDGYVSGQDISKKLKVTRASVWKDMQRLRKTGYGISAVPRKGYRLVSVPDKLFSDEIGLGLKTKIVGRQILSYDDLDSTNDAAMRLGEQGVKEGTCVFAEYQKKGRGRLGRTWAAPKGKNVLFSVLLRPLLPASEISKITLAAAVSVAKAVKKHTGKVPGIKWPNDVLFEEAKVCGILTEMSGEADRVNFVVLGIGVNVNADPSQLPPGSISLKKIAAREISRVDFARDLLKELDDDYARLKEGRFAELAEEWEGFSATSGRRVTATLSGRKIQGQATGIDKDGALWIRTDSGLQERITAGDIQHLRPA